MDWRLIHKTDCVAGLNRARMCHSLHLGASVVDLARIVRPPVVLALNEELLRLLLLLLCGHQVELALQVLADGPAGLLWVLCCLVVTRAEQLLLLLFNQLMADKVIRFPQACLYGSRILLGIRLGVPATRLWSAFSNPFLALHSSSLVETLLGIHDGLAALDLHVGLGDMRGCGQEILAVIDDRHDSALALAQVRWILELKAIIDFIN